MTKSIAIYAEGGGDTAETSTPFRQGMSAFLKPAVTVARRKNIRWRIIACGGRTRTFDLFKDALKKEPHVISVLLVDAEEFGPFLNPPKPWKHLKHRKGDEWDQPEGCADDHCQLMVICMEAWFLAHPDAIAKHFGKNFDRSKLPAPNLAESRSKSNINTALQQAAKNTAAKEYKKIRDGAKILAIIVPSEVRKHCKWCERLFTTLGKFLDAEL